MKKFLNRLKDRYKSLSFKTKNLLKLGVILGLVVALPLFVYAIQNVNLEIRKKAASGENPPVCWNVVTSQNGKLYWPDGCQGIYLPGSLCTAGLVPLTTQQTTDYDRWVSSGKPAISGCTQTNPPFPTTAPAKINWKTEYGYLTADDFYIIADGKKYTSAGATVSVGSNPPTPQDKPTYMTLEMIWQEKETEMRMFIYFYAEDVQGASPPRRQWGISEIRTYNGRSPGDWIYYKYRTPLADIGNFYQTSELKLPSSPDNNLEGEFYFKNLKMQAFTTQLTPTSSPIPTPAATPQPWYQTLNFRVKFTGVSDDQADGAKVKARFVNSKVGVDQQTTPFTVSHIGNGVYEGIVTFKTTASSPILPVTDGYEIYIKGEKHLARKFCQQQGQSSRCTAGGLIYIGATNVPSTQTFDFSGLSLEPGDLPGQDGVANASDFQKIKNLLSKSCTELTDQDKLTADLDYSGCVNVRDAFLMRTTLETRYDE